MITNLKDFIDKCKKASIKLSIEERLSLQNYQFLNNLE